MRREDSRTRPRGARKSSEQATCQYSRARVGMMPRITAGRWSVLCAEEALDADHASVAGGRVHGVGSRLFPPGTHVRIHGVHIHSGSTIKEYSEEGAATLMAIMRRLRAAVYTASAASRAATAAACAVRAASTAALAASRRAWSLRGTFVCAGHVCALTCWRVGLACWSGVLVWPVGCSVRQSCHPGTHSQALF